MISSHDRSGWIGASDSFRVMQSWNTKTFAMWWMEKLGLRRNTYVSPEMSAGTYYEHRILEYLGIARMDRQIKIPALRLRVNLDGEDAATVYEVKTYRYDFRVTNAYVAQCMVEMLATGKGCILVAYHLTDDDYENYYNPIDPDRISYYHIPYDPQVIARYLPRLCTLAWAMRKGVRPDESHLQKPALRQSSAIWRLEARRRLRSAIRRFRAGRAARD